MMEIIKLNASPRPEAGKGPSTRLRREGKIPAIAYGRDLAATPLAVSPKALLQVLGSAHGQNSVVELDVEGGEKLTVMVRDYAYHPITRELVHADFVQVKLDSARRAVAEHPLVTAAIELLGAELKDVRLAAEMDS